MIDIVIPTVGRSSLSALLTSLAGPGNSLVERIIIVDDRSPSAGALDIGCAGAELAGRITVIRGEARGPAAARNRGWRASQAEWIAFLDDDVVVDNRWYADLGADVGACPADAAASVGTVDVPLPAHRKPTDWERNVAALAGARWITANCAYRRDDLLAVDGFDERFPRAFREDADLALRTLARGRRIVDGRRRVVHPVRAAASRVSIALQAGNADDVLMEALHGADWYERAGASRGTFGQHVRIVTFAGIAAGAATAWFVATLAFAWSRIAPGPRTRDEIGAMLVTSFGIPFAAVAHRLSGYATLPAQLARGARVVRSVPRAVLFDRDGTLVEDVPDNGEPAAVRPLSGARTALARLRAAGIAIGIVSNQSGIARGTLTAEQVAAVHARVVDLLGPIDTIHVCPHAAGDGCACRKPAPGLIVEAARALGLAASQCVVIGDIGSDIAAARAAGATAILVPTAVTLPAEIAAAGIVAENLTAAVDLVLSACL